jgi:hypothetical protein
MRLVSRLLGPAGCLAVLFSLLLTSVPASASGSISPVVGGLKIPRGIAFDAKGAMYVAEAGLPGAGFDGVTTTGAVNRYEFTGSAWSRSWSTSFNSAYTHAHGPTEVLGPSGLSARGNRVFMIMALNSHEVPLPQFGHLYQINPTTGAAFDRGDIGDDQFAWADANKNLWEEFPDSNPYGVLISQGDAETSSGVFVIDAGSNTVSKVVGGRTEVIAYIPNETPVAGLPTRDSTPTCAAQGPDGALYIGTLDLFRNFGDPNQGWSHVYRVDPKAHENFLTAAHVWASGLTTITACAFDSQGNFWATEMFKANAAGPPGDVVRIKFSDPAHPEHIGGGQLPLPGGLAQGPDGAIYVTVGSTGLTSATGAVMRVAG